MGAIATRRAAVPGFRATSPTPTRRSSGCALVGALQTIEPTIGVDALDLVGRRRAPRLRRDRLDRERSVRPRRRPRPRHRRPAPRRPLRARAPRRASRATPVQLRVVLSTRSDPALPLHRWRAARPTRRAARAPSSACRQPRSSDSSGTVGVEVSPARRGRPRRPHRGLGGGRATRRALDAARGRAGRVHPHVRRHRSQRRRLPRRRGARRQPDDVVDFLLDTSVLDELSAPLCDALTGRSDSAAMLHRLEHDHLFVVPLDHEQTLYRYHHLFAELLRRMLAARHPGRALELHRTASDWYAEHDDPRRAVRHAILAEDPILVTQLLRGRMFAEFFTGSSEMIREWINELSRAHVAMPADLMLEYTLALSLIGALEDARVWLTRADKMLNDDAPAVSRARLAIAHALTLGLRGEIEAAIGARRTSACTRRTRCRCLHRRDAAARDAANRHLHRRPCRRPGTVRTLTPAARRSGTARSGHLRRHVLAGRVGNGRAGIGAAAHAEAAAAAMERLDAVGHFGSNDALRTLGALAYEHDHLDEAEELLERCVEIVANGSPDLPPAHAPRARARWNARGDPEATFTELDRARAALPPDVQSPLIDRSRRTEHASWPNAATSRTRSRARGEPPRRTPPIRRRGPEPSRREECRGRARDPGSAQLIEHDSTPGAGVRPPGRPRRARGATTTCGTRSCERVLDLGRSAGFLRTLADEGPELAAALADALRHQPADAYSDRLLPVLERAIAAAPAQNVPLFGGVMLSERELTVLKYLATRLTTREIAAELYVSMNTFRTHTKSIYRKLGVDSRAAPSKPPAPTGSSETPRDLMRRSTTVSVVERRPTRSAAASSCRRRARRSCPRGR